MKVCIIGGGASGIMAAIVASLNGEDVTILEHMNRIGKKILVTGSGRCNLSNTDMNLDHFHGGDTELIRNILEKFSKDDTLTFFSKLGLYTTNKNGYLYPFSEQASSVIDMFLAKLRDEKVKIITECNIKKITVIDKSYKSCFDISTDKGAFEFDKVIIATGSKASSKTGSDGSGYEIAKRLGHSIVKPLPALCGLRCEGDYFKSIAGIRTKASICILSNGKFLGSDNGELQINDYGISGIPTMQISYLAAKALDKKEKVYVKISFMPEFTKDTLLSFLKSRIVNNPQYISEELLVTILNKKLSNLLLKLCNIKKDTPCISISASKLDELCDLILNFTVKVKSTNDFENSQVCQGGVSLYEVDNNLQSKLVKGLYFAGEILDVNGDCGGYNLQWAWSSGYVAGCLRDA